LNLRGVGHEATNVKCLFGLESKNYFVFALNLLTVMVIATNENSIKRIPGAGESSVNVERIVVSFPLIVVTIVETTGNCPRIISISSSIIVKAEVILLAPVKASWKSGWMAEDIAAYSG
jgi:hypothetical protein